MAIPEHEILDKLEVELEDSSFRVLMWREENVEVADRKLGQRIF